MRMRFVTRAFIWSFVPLRLHAGGGFWFVQQRRQSTVRDGLRSSPLDAHLSMARLRTQSELQNSRLLRIVGENPSLKAGLQLVISEPKSKAARLTLEDQLREIAETLRFDLLLVSNSDNRPIGRDPARGRPACHRGHRAMEASAEGLLLIWRRYLPVEFVSD